MTATTTTEPQTTATALDEALTWLSDEFPGWDFSRDTTTSWQGEPRIRWVATSPGHHPQAELSASKLHTRLQEYLRRREARFRFADDN